MLNFVAAHHFTLLIIFNFLLIIGMGTTAFSTTAINVPVAYYEEIKDLPNHFEKLLVDVREPSELQATGRIPTSINVPCK